MRRCVLHALVVSLVSPSSSTLFVKQLARARQCICSAGDTLSGGMQLRRQTHHMKTHLYSMPGWILCCRDTCCKDRLMVMVHF